MSLNYNVQEHLIIDLDRAGAAGSAVWEALVEQVRALEDLLDEDEVCIYRLELWADGEPVPVDRKISCAGLGQALKGARRMEMVLRFNSTWRGTDAVYDDALPFDLTETAAQLTRAEQACRRLITTERSCNLNVEDGKLAFFLNYVLLSGQEDWLRLKAGMDAVCDIVGGVGMDIKLVDDSGPDVRLLVVDPQLDGSDCFGLYAIPEA